MCERANLAAWLAIAAAVFFAVSSDRTVRSFKADVAQFTAGVFPDSVLIRVGEAHIRLSIDI